MEDRVVQPTHRDTTYMFGQILTPPSLESTTSSHQFGPNVIASNNKGLGIYNARYFVSLWFQLLKYILEDEKPTQKLFVVIKSPT